MFKILLFFLLLFLNGCGSCFYECPAGSENNVAESISQFTLSCDDCEKYVLEEAMDIWNSAIDKSIFVINETNIAQVNVFIVDKIPYELPENIVGFTHYERDGTWKIYILNTVKSNPKILAHELGHVLQFRHSTCRNSITYQDASGEITTEIKEILNEKFK